MTSGLGIFPFPDDLWVKQTIGEANAVEQRMTTPSGSLVNGLSDYVESEQANNNWDLTDGVLMMDIDSSVNALTEWKADNYTSNNVRFEPYIGWDFYEDPVLVKSLLGTESIINLPDLKFSTIDSFVGWREYAIEVGTINVSYKYNLGNTGGTDYGARTWLYTDGLTLGHKNF